MRAVTAGRPAASLCARAAGLLRVPTRPCPPPPPSIARADFAWNGADDWVVASVAEDNILQIWQLAESIWAD